MKRTCISLVVAALLGSGAAHATYTPTVTTTNNNFTMVGATNGNTGGTNDVTFTWDGTYRTSVETDGLYNAELSSPTAFSGKKWTAHHVNVYGPGTYTFYTGCASGGATSTTYNPSCGLGTPLTLTVGAGQVGAHMLFNWSTSTDIDVIVVWDMNKSWTQTGTLSPFNTTTNVAGNTVNTVWGGVSIDADGDTYSGAKMVDGPFIGQSANFSVNGIVAATPPTLSSVSPANGATVSAGATTTYVVNFSAPMDTATVTSSLLSFSPAVTVGTPTFDTTKTQFTFPVSLASGTAYTVSFNNSGVKAASGIQLTAPANQTLTTRPLSVSSTTPANGSSGYNPGSVNFAVTFSETMAPATVTAGYLSFSPAVTVGTPTTTDNRTFYFPVTLSASTSYTVAFGTGPQDATGGPVTTYAAVGFSTAAVADTTSPTVVTASRTPAPGATSVALTPALSVTFSEAMGPTTAGAIHVTKVSDSSTVPCTFTPDSTNKIFSCTIGSNLDFASDYTVSVTGDAARTPSNASAAQDANGNNLITSANNSWTFTTRAAVTSMSGSGVTVTTSAGEMGSVSSSVSAPSNSTPVPGVTYDADYVTYTVNSIPSGTSTVAVSITFQNSIAGKNLYKIDANGSYAQISESNTIAAGQGCTFRRDATNDKVAIVTIRDNDTCDTDSSLGAISDPIVAGAPVVVAVTAPTLGSAPGGGGCAADTSGKDAGLLVVLLAGLGYTGWRRQRDAH